MSPMAQSRSPARIRSSVSSDWASGSSPTVSRPMSARLSRPAATSSRSASIAAPPAVGRNVPSCSTRSSSTPVNTRDALAPRGAGRSGRSTPAPRRRANRSAASTTVTSTPNRASAWASSPRWDRRRARPGCGQVGDLMTSRLVQYGVSARPSIGGTRGSVPVLRTTPRAAAYSTPSTSTTPGAARRPWPRTSRAPASSSRRRWRRRSSRGWPPRRSGWRRARPVGLDVAGAGERRRPGGPRRAWSAARIIILEGMQP